MTGLLEATPQRASCGVQRDWRGGAEWPRLQSGLRERRTEGVRVSEPFLRWAAVLDYVLSPFASGGGAVNPCMRVLHFPLSFQHAPYLFVPRT